jgi:hypothetical protein
MGLNVCGIFSRTCPRTQERDLWAETAVAEDNQQNTLSTELKQDCLRQWQKSLLTAAAKVFNFPKISIGCDSSWLCFATKARCVGTYSTVYSHSFVLLCHLSPSLPENLNYGSHCGKTVLCVDGPVKSRTRSLGV